MGNSSSRGLYKAQHAHDPALYAQQQAAYEQAHHDEQLRLYHMQLQEQEQLQQPRKITPVKHIVVHLIRDSDLHQYLPVVVPATAPQITHTQRGKRGQTILISQSAAPQIVAHHVNDSLQTLTPATKSIHLTTQATYTLMYQERAHIQQEDTVKTFVTLHMNFQNTSASNTGIAYTFTILESQFQIHFTDDPNSHTRVDWNLDHLEHKPQNL
jgi:hypothetical protein